MKTEIRVLVVDDDEVDYRMSKRALLDCPYPVKFDIDTAGTLSQAIARLGAGRYDVALLDLGLPDSTGLDTVKKAIVAAGDVPIVVLTGLADDKTGLSAIDAGAADYLVKDPSISGMLGRTLLHALERKKVELKLKKAMEAKADLVNMVSHDLRIPLTAIKEGIDIVLGGDAGAVNDEQKDFLGLAKRNVDRLTRLITDFLDIQKIAADKQQFNMQQNDVNELIRDVHRMMEPVARQKGLDFHIELEKGLPRIKFDYDGITRVVTNLVSNALKFTVEGGIIIRTRIDGDTIIVAVSDTGCGISADNLKILFKKYGQVKSSAVKDVESTGLGLAISKQIVEHHRGKIWAESQPGRGSTFYFYLPVLSRVEGPVQSEVEGPVPSAVEGS
ncbi:MAG: hybrid sensor histidine kinase/response regulator [Sedimentisphaerales bacterium]|nr:hybrid sensor histidine kinase/response regulator [Sedimentisphaerales bacterium]